MGVFDKYGRSHSSVKLFFTCEFRSKLSLFRLQCRRGICQNPQLYSALQFRFHPQESSSETKTRWTWLWIQLHWLGNLCLFAIHGVLIAIFERFVDECHV